MLSIQLTHLFSMGNVHCETNRTVRLKHLHVKFLYIIQNETFNAK